MIAGAVYCRVLRERMLCWGVTPPEEAARLPGDELLEDSDGVATRAIEIHAPASVCGSGWLTWVRRHVAACARMTGSRTCSA